MARLILVCGPTGAGKTTYSIGLCKDIGAVKFSIDPWMQTLFSKDMTSLNYAWMIERVNRCYDQIWEVSKQILALDGNVLLDLGFTAKSQREIFVKKAQALNIDAEVHYLDAPTDVRKTRVNKRNMEKDPAVYSFEVTDMMFNFMEPRFEVPDSEELKHGLTVNVSSQ
ncbi:ATP-binding protein [Enterovibrio sp. ZSDZ42]|uniref:ATP-binding protein n=1 Tax=Enterovibrio gelatinilyticus TaxID=2899819 RepID=A0ABT5R2P4_9GAMM|nr:ATP-binding protein [Enterovibrio sp. ZSDZ42]MDD1794543.1 ATP-binding protein [Enterovibrio sp. ZSDZ42]